MPNMKAIYLSGHGGDECVVVGERPKPIRRRGEILIDMRAGGFNRVDLYMRDSGAGITHSLPQILGVDGAGVVADADDEETRFKPGDAVAIHPGVGCGRCEFCVRGEQVLCLKMQFLGEHRDGTFAQYLSVPAENVFPLPAGFDFVEGAALGCSYLTAWRMVFTKAQIKPWETALIFGIGGSVSTAALQMVKLAGARAIITSRDAEKLQKAQQLGADAVINGKTEDVARRALELTDGRGVDVVIENVGEAVWASALKSLVRGGRIVLCGATSGDQPKADLRRLFIRQLQVIGSTHGNLAEFGDMLTMCGRGLLRPVIDSRYAAADVHAALHRLEAGRQCGKIGLTLDNFG